MARPLLKNKEEIMRHYPIAASDVIDQADIDAGRTNLVYPYMDLVHLVNDAFFDGFLLAHCESKEGFESITVEDRIGACFLAKHMMDEFLPQKPETREVTV